MERREPLTLSQLVQMTGIDRRTIAYYVQEGLLPKVGRRGRWTRYAPEFLDRLLFIRRVRGLQDEGRLRAVMLSEIRDVMDGLSPEELRAAAEGDAPEEWVRGLFSEPDLDLSDVAVAAEDVAAGFASPPAESELEGAGPVAFSKRERRAGARGRRDRLQALSIDPESPVAMSVGAPFSPPSPGSAQGEGAQAAAGDVERLRELLGEIERRVRGGAGARRSGGTSEQVTRVPISESVYLAVKDLGEDDAELVEELARLLRAMGGEG